MRRRYTAVSDGTDRCKFTDCLVLQVADEHGIKQIFGFDRKKYDEDEHLCGGISPGQKS